MTSVCLLPLFTERNTFLEDIDRCAKLLRRLQDIEGEQVKQQATDSRLSAILQQIGLLLLYAAAVQAFTCLQSDKNHLCIKLKDLRRQFMRRLYSRSICWKYLLVLMLHFRLTLEKEFDQPLKWFDLYGDFKMTDSFEAKLPFLVQ